MQQLRAETKSRGSVEACVKELLVAVPSVMRFIRSQMRQNRQVELTVPQFRVLVLVSCAEDASLSAVAEHLGLSLPAASRMVDLLVKRGLVDRRIPPNDRRRVSLSLTRLGKDVFKSARAATEVAMVQSLRTLSPGELTRVGEAMRILSRVFALERCSIPAEK